VAFAVDANLVGTNISHDRYCLFYVRRNAVSIGNRSRRHSERIIGEPVTAS
jgi:hypothetical protein